MKNYYLTPIDGSGTEGDPFHPKYTDTTLAGLPWTSVVYDGTAILAVNTDPGTHATMSGHADVTAVPDLDRTVGGAQATVSAALESHNIPGDWVTGGMTYRTVLLWVIRFFLFLQRLNGKHAEKMFQLAENLDTLVSEISAQRRSNMNDVAQDYGFDTSAITGAMTLRQALKIIIQQSDVPVQWSDFEENH